ncbi:MAG: ATP-binding protein [Bacteroidales bacterium]
MPQKCIFICLIPFMILTGKPDLFGQQYYIDSVEQVLDQEKDDRMRARLLLKLTAAYRNVNPYRGLDYAGRGLQIARTIGDRQIEAAIINEMGVSYRKVDMYEQALEMHLKALKLFEDLDDNMGIAFALANIGNVYFALDQHHKALDYNMQSLKIKRLLNDKEQLIYSLRTTALALQALNDYQRAKALLQEALDIAVEINEEYNIANLYYHLGNLAFESNADISVSVQYYEKALAMYNRLENWYGTAISTYEMALAHLEMGEDTTGYELLQKTLQLSKQNGLIKITMDAYLALSQWHKSHGNLSAALDLYIRYSNLHDSLFSETTSRNIAEMQAKYDLTRQQAQIELLENEQRLHTAYQWFYIMAIVFVSSFGVLIFLRYREKKKILARLEEEIEQRKTQQARLLESEQKLREANATKDKFFSIISHDLKSPFGAIMGLSELLNEDYDRYDDHSRKRLICEIHKATVSTYSLLKDLLAWSQSQRGLMKFDPQQTNLARLCHENLDFVKTAAQKKEISLNCNVSPDLNVMADRNMLTTIIRNLLSNAVKFTPRGGEVMMSAILTNNSSQERFVEVTVSDNGIGMNESNLVRLFKIEEKFKTYGTERETGTGLGLIICREFIEKHGGTICAESREGHGSTFRFTLPAAH